MVGSPAIVSVSCQLGVNLPGSDIIISVMMDGIGHSTAATGANGLFLLSLASVLQVLRRLLVGIEVVDRVRAADLSCLHAGKLLLLLPLLFSSVELDRGCELILLRSVTLGWRLESVSVDSSWVVPGRGETLGTELVWTASDGFWVWGRMCDNIVALQRSLDLFHERNEFEKEHEQR